MKNNYFSLQTILYIIDITLDKITHTNGEDTHTISDTHEDTF